MSKLLPFPQPFIRLNLFSVIKCQSNITQVLYSVINVHYIFLKAKINVNNCGNVVIMRKKGPLQFCLLPLVPQELHTFPV